MEFNETKLKSEKYLRARNRVDEIKKFYKHLTVFLLISAFFIGRRMYREHVFEGSFVDIIEAFIGFNHYGFIKWWALAVIIHAITTFVIPNLYGKNWEERKIQELMNEKR